MTQTVSPQQVAAPPIRALIIWPDYSYELRTIEQNVDTFQGLVGGWFEPIPTEHGVFWREEDSEYKGCPTNTLATYLWWNLCPAMEGKEVLQGAVFVTGGPDGTEHSLPVPDEVIEYFERMPEIYLEEEGES
jgi:Domain of unknown function (DUF3846)